MLTVRLVCVGKLKETYWREAVAEYEKRLRPFCKFEIRELPEERLPSDPSSAQIQAALEREGEAILKQSAGQLIPLCIEGKQTGSEGFARRLSAAMQSPGAVTLAIGSSYGLSPQVKQAGEGLSMSEMTFPHQLARVMLCEQLYRAFQILNHTKYHK
ncbi:MAG: 23S rRNA (pseudouridine(1915)-N(3))-methyltransferase RlmH [Neglectibacter timonensis]